MGSRSGQRWQSPRHCESENGLSPQGESGRSGGLPSFRPLHVGGEVEMDSGGMVRKRDSDENSHI